MSSTMNVRAAKFARRELFLAEPDEGHPVASVAVGHLAYLFCATDACGEVNEERHLGCRRHTRAVLVGMSKLIVSGDVLPELSTRGVLFARLSADGVIEPLTWSKPPSWLERRPQLVQWARDEVATREQRRRWESRV